MAQPRVLVADAREIATKGKAIYERLKEELEAHYLHKFVAIDVESGDYFLGGTLTEASQKAHEQYPDRVSFVARVGHPAAVVHR